MSSSPLPGSSTARTSKPNSGHTLLGVPMVLGEAEPEAGPWRIASLPDVVWVLLGRGRAVDGRPRIVAVDGRSASGKTTFAERLRAAVPGAAVVHTDDIAWWHSRFGCDDLMVGGVLEPLHRGEAVHYQPPAWASHGRTVQIDVSAKAPVVIIEGVGAARRELSQLMTRWWPKAGRRVTSASGMPMDWVWR